jgi:hypothetical protein
MHLCCQRLILNFLARFLPGKETQAGRTDPQLRASLPSRGYSLRRCRGLASGTLSGFYPFFDSASSTVTSVMTRSATVELCSDGFINAE